MDGSSLQSRMLARSHVEAAAWRSRLTEARLESSEAFEHWLATSPENRIAWQHMQAPWQVLTEHAHSPEVIELRRAALNRVRTNIRQRSRRYLWPRWSFSAPMQWAAAAAVAVVVTGVVTLWFLNRPEVYSTSLGERRVVALPDGSKLALDSLTEVRMRFSDRARELTLTRGQARFDVARDSSRPFKVRVEGNEIVALGTAFNVDRLNDRTYVTLLEGKIMVRRSPLKPAIMLHPSEQLVLAPDVKPVAHTVKAQQISAWESGQLVFENEPLASVVERINRYSSRRIEFVDSSISQLKVTGVFNMGDVWSFVTTATTLLPIKAVEGRPGGIRLMSVEENS